MTRTLRAGVAAGLGVVYVVLLVAAVAPAAPLFLAGAVVVVTTELVLSRRAPFLLPEVLNAHLGVRFRLLSLDVLTALLAARLLPDAGGIVALAVLAVLLLAGGRDAAGVFVRRANWRRAGGPVSWRNLAVASLPHPQPLRPTPELDVGLTLLTLLIPLGYTIGSLSDRFTAAVAAQWIVIASVVLFLGGRLVQYLVLNRPPYPVVREAVRDAVEAFAPQLVVHHSGRRGTVEQVLLWVPALRSLDRRCLILVREQSHLAALDGCGIPVVWAPRSQDVELFMVPSIELALYPSDATNINNHLLRVPGIYDVLIGHGDSDEAESRSPIARMYDEVWVAGPAGRARYAYPVSGVRDARIREIGPLRPAPSAVTRDPRPTVVYAPSWENAVDAVDVSSLVTAGDAIVEALLARQDVRLVFAPAAPTGARVPAYANAVARLRRRIDRAGDGHRTVGPEALPGELAAAAFAVVDVSPALAEAVRCDVPFAVPAVGTLDAAGMARTFPTTAAGSVLRDLPRDAFAALDDALGADEHAAARLALGRRLDASGDFSAHLRSAVDEAVAAQRRRRAFARPTPAG